MDATRHRLDALIEKLPLAMEQLWRGDAPRPDIDAMLAAAGIDSRVEFRGPFGSLEFSLDGIDDEAAAARRMRTAIARRVGRLVGADKRWDLGAFDVTMLLRHETLTLHFHAKYSISAIRQAARDWLEGADGPAWLRAHGFIDPDTEPNERGFWPKPEHVVPNPFARRFDDGRIGVHLHVDPESRPPGILAGSDEGVDETLAYLSELLGEPEDPRPFAKQLWRRGRRSFAFGHMRSRTRSAEFDEDPL